MAYPYSDPKVDFAHRKKSYADLSLPDQGTMKVFDPNFSAKMPSCDGLDLDKIAQKDFNRYSECPLRSCDSLQKGTDGCYYLVEFKNQASGNINRDEIHKKIIDSLSLILYAFAPTDSIRSLYKWVKAYVVFPDQNAFLKIVKTVATSGSAQKAISLTRPLWGLDELVKHEFIGYVDTMPLSDFQKEVTTWPKMVLP